MHTNTTKCCNCKESAAAVLGPNNCRGLTIVEVLISMLLLTFIVGALYTGTEAAFRGSTLNAQRVAAYGLCQDYLEQMRGGSFADICYANFPSKTVKITTGSGFNATNITTGTISCVISNMANPSRKMVTITVRWNYRNMTNQEMLAGCIVDRLAAASLQGTLTGKLYLNPAGEDPLQFLLTLTDGSTLDFASVTNLPQPDISTIFYARHLRVQVGGGGTQTSVQYNYQPFPMANEKQWDIDDTQSFRASIRYETTVTPNCWRIRLTGQGAVISTQ